jgi:type III secretion system TyeA family effector delivery regulator
VSLISFMMELNADAVMVYADITKLKSARYDREALRAWLCLVQGLEFAPNEETFAVEETGEATDAEAAERAGDEAASEKAGEEKPTQHRPGSHRGARGARGRAGGSASQDLLQRGEQGRAALSAIDQQFLSELEDEAREMYGQHHTLIDAALNAAPALAASDNPNLALQIYHGIVTESKNFTDTCKRLLQNFEFDKLDPIIEMMTKALADDLHATQSSVDKGRLAAILGPLSQMRVFDTLRDLYTQFCEQIKGIARQHGMKLPVMNPNAVLTGLLDIVDGSWAAAHKFESLVRSLGITGESEIVVVMQGIGSMLRQLPEKAFNEDTRVSVREAAQQAIDAAVQREEDRDLPPLAAG